MNVQDRQMDPISPFPSPFGASLMGLGDAGYSDSPNSYYNPGSAGADTITSFMQQMQQAEQSSPLGSLMGMTWPANAFNMFAQMGSMFQQLLGGGNPNYGSEQYYSSASGGSVGDPHLSFNGSTWNDMNSEPDLLHSDSIHGGYQLSTQTTAPNASGVTYNQSATVTTHNGATAVTLNNNGNATITQNGVTSNLSPGQTVDLGNETVAHNQDGSLQITNTNQSGGQITTTMRQNGNGVDVNVSAGNVDLGGAMVNGSNSSASNPQPSEPAPRQLPISSRPIVQPWEPDGPAMLF
ncbi:MAG: hypothetical protein WA629_09080 [Candidatus Aquilonibacter sp.]